MLVLTATNDPSPHIKRRARTMRVRTIAFDSYVVTPREEGKAKRLVQFDMSNQGVVRVECVKQDGTGELCEANAFSKPCAHVEAAIRRLAANIKKLSDPKKPIERSKRVRRAIKQTTSKRLNFYE
jgi:hypothetical protein